MLHDQKLDVREDRSHQRADLYVAYRECGVGYLHTVNCEMSAVKPVFSYAMKFEGHFL